MKVREIFCVAILLMIVLCSSINAYAQSKAGTSAAPELLIPVGAAGVALAGAGISSVSGPGAIFWNPAGLDVMSVSASALFSHRSYIADMGVNYLAVAGKFESIGSFGLTVRTFQIGDIHVTTEFQPDGTGEIITPTFFTIGMTYSRKLTERISVGVTSNIVSESFGNVSATGVAFDAGIQYRNLGRINGLSLGICVKNIGTPMKYDGSALYIKAFASGYERDETYYKVEAATFQMPSVIEIGLGYERKIGEQFDLHLSCAYEENNFGIDEYRIGAEFMFQNFLAERVGYLYSTDPSGTKSIFQNFSLGFGVFLEKSVGIPVVIDYAYVPVKYFDGNHIIDVRIDF